MVVRQEDLGRTISLEEGKAIAEGRLEANRAVETMMAPPRRPSGSTVRPFRSTARRAVPARWPSPLRVPCGVVLAISPFNFPLNLVCHKVGPGDRRAATPSS